MNIYIDYNEKDRRIVDKIEQYLSTFANVLHKGKILAGKHAKNEIKKMVNKSDYFMVIISRDYVSRNDHAHFEAYEKSKVIPIIAGWSFFDDMFKGCTFMKSNLNGDKQNPCGISDKKIFTIIKEIQNHIQ